jgi:hypothetical protein
MRLTDELGLVVISDCWAALRDEEYTHFTVNRFITFVDETTGAHTNTIKSTWKQVKTLLSPYNRKADYVYFLAEYMFRLRCEAEGVYPFRKFI